MTAAAMGMTGEENMSQNQPHLTHSKAVIEPLEQRILLTSGPDLTGAFGTILINGKDDPQAIILPGSKLSIEFTVTNQGDVTAAGHAGYDLFASTDQILDVNDDTLLLSLPNKPVDLAPGESFLAKVKTTIPLDTEVGDYFLIVRISPDAAVGDVNPANNVVATAGAMPLRLMFGTIGGRSVKLKYRDADGTDVKLSLKGGTAELVRNTSGGLDLVTEGTTSKSSLSVSAGKGGDRVFELDDVLIDSSIKSVKFKGVRVRGNVMIKGGLGKLTLGDLSDDASHTIEIGAAADIKALSLTLGRVKNLVRLYSDTFIKSMKIVEWIDDGAPDALFAPGIGKLSVKGNKKLGIRGHFEPNVFLWGVPGLTTTLGGAKIAGSLQQGKWSVIGGSKGIAATGVGSDWAGSFTGILGSFAIKGDAGGLLTALAIGKIKISGNLTNALYISGASLGNEVALGGVGGAADSFGPGAIGSISIGGNVSGTVIAAGLDPVDGEINNGDDVLVGGFASFIKKFAIKGQADFNSYFGAGVFPKTVKIGKSKIDPLTDRRFMLSPGVTRDAFINQDGYPAPGMISFTDASGVAQQVFGFPGQVQIFAGAGSSDEIEDLVEANSGDIISQIPYLDYYLASVAPGTEGSFITSLFTSGLVADAFPNLMLERGYIDLTDIPSPNPDGSFPKDMDLQSRVDGNTHLFVIDDFVREDINAGDPPTHGHTVGYVAAKGLPAPGAHINISALSIGGEYALTTDLWMIALMVVSQELGYDTNANAIINVSLEGSMRGSGGNNLSDEQYKANIEATLRQYATALDFLGAVNPQALERIAIVTIAGNGNPSGVDLSDVIGRLRKDFPKVFPPEASGGGDHLMIVGGTHADSDQVDKGFNYSSNAGDVFYAPANTVVVDDKGGTVNGTSYAAPAVTNLLQQTLIANPGMTVSQVTKAFRAAYLRLGRLPTLGELLGEVTGRPVITIDDALIKEGDQGIWSSLAFAVRLTEPVSDTVTVSYTTVGGSATSGKDFARSSGTVTFAPGQTLLPIRVNVIGDGIQEGNETFSVNLTGANGAVMGDSQALGTIIDDDVAGITVTPTDGLSTDESGGKATFTVVLNSKPKASVKIPLSSSDTTEGKVSPTSVTFTTKNWNKPRTVTITGQSDDEPDGDVPYTITTGPAISTDPFYAGLNPSDVSVINRRGALSWSVSINVSAAGQQRSYSGNVSIPLTGGSANFKSNGATITVSIAGSMLTISGTGFGSEGGASAWGTASGSGAISENSTSFSAGGGLNGTLIVTYPDGSKDNYAITGSFTATAGK